MAVSVKPDRHSPKSKTQQVREMFDKISGHYDFLNHFLSMGIDTLWRKKMVRIARRTAPRRILDIATGTGDQAILLARRLHPEHVDAVDLSEKMMDIGRKKARKKGLEHIITFRKADCQSLPFDFNTFDLVTISFGVRNFENLAQSLSEIHRVLKPGGMLLILEFSRPTAFPVKQLYNFYSRYVLPMVGRLISRDPKAYTYLPESIQAFPAGRNFINLLRSDGFVGTRFISLTGGIATIYSAIKPREELR